jgi:hypothetical protein
MFRTTRRILTVLAGLSFVGWAQNLGQTENPHQLVQLNGIQVTGTRLPPDSIIKISGLKIGQMVNDEVLKRASDKVTSTGLVKGLDYGYNAEPGKPGVYLSLKVFDEGPLLPVQIMPVQDAPAIWSCLQSADPIFTDQMPNTEKAIHFYSINMARCLGNLGATSRRVAATVACDGTGKSIAINFHVTPEGRPAGASPSASH